MLHPVGPEPPRVYWLRRGALLVLLAVVIVGIAQACGGGGGSGGTPRSQPTPTGGLSTTPTSSPVSRCARTDLVVDASTDASTYPAGALPHLSAIVRNAGSAACRFVTAPRARTWRILSGADQVWSSADCTLSGVVAHQRLKPGKTIAYGLVWDRHRSAAGCPSPTQVAGPGTYRLYVTVNGVRAATVVFHLTS
ncbi:MAG: hypothetical protein QOJ03_554 [Frankiaceae bacterium]|nr:hypothetical protein [Frankiaceae bacterium]